MVLPDCDDLLRPLVAFLRQRASMTLKKVEDLETPPHQRRLPQRPQEPHLGARNRMRIPRTTHALCVGAACLATAMAVNVAEDC